MSPDSRMTDPAQAAKPAEAAPKVSKGVLYPSIAIMLALIAVVILFPQQFATAIETASNALVNATGWYYILVVVALTAFVIVVACTRKGDIVLGKDEDEPEYSLGSWFAMLFAAGMGIGLVFYGVAEPLTHFETPHPGVAPDVASRAKDAMATTFLHWGLSAWAIYVVVGLGVAYAIHRKGLPVSIRWALRPLLGSKTDGPIGAVIDVVAVLGTLLGVATSLGLGVMQLSSGIEYMTGIELPKAAVIAVAVAISLVAAISVSTGLEKGVKKLSNANLVLAALLLVAVLVLGPTLFIFNEFVQDVGYYLQNLVILSFRTMPFEGATGSDWMNAWTIYYWGWWISWSPFVGIFIARISRGRTIREFILGAVLVPTLVTFFWFAVMGGTALYQQIFGPANLAGADGLVDNTTALFQMFANMPASKVLSGIALVLLAVFFITSAESASYVMAMISSGGSANPTALVRLVWALVTGAVAVVLIAAGDGAADGVGALQKLVITSALPMTVVLVLMSVALWRDTSKEVELLAKREHRLMRSRLVDETVASVVSQIDETVKSSDAIDPIAAPASFWRPPYARAGGKARGKKKDVTGV